MRMMMKYVIINEYKQAFWSNKNGWGDLIDATRFEEVETEICFLPADSRWIKEEDAKCLKVALELFLSEFGTPPHKWLTEGEKVNQRMKMMNDHAIIIAQYILDSDCERDSYQEYIEEGNDPREHVYYSASVVMGCASEFDQDIEDYLK